MKRSIDITASFITLLLLAPLAGFSLVVAIGIGIQTILNTGIVGTLVLSALTVLLIAFCVARTVKVLTKGLNT